MRAFAASICSSVVYSFDWNLLNDHAWVFVKIVVCECVGMRFVEIDEHKATKQSTLPFLKKYISYSSKFQILQMPINMHAQ